MLRFGAQSNKLPLQALQSVHRYGSFTKLGVPFGVPLNKDYSLWGSLDPKPYLGKLSTWLFQAPDLTLS